MKLRHSPLRFRAARFERALSIFCGVILLAAGPTVTLAQQTPAAAESQATTSPAPPAQAPISNDQLDSLVAPIALYSDQLLAMTLAASTYPLEIIQLQQWMDKNKNLKGKALGDAVAKQPWDPSVQSLTAYPDLVKRLSGNVQWTADLGNAFLAQQTDVMDAVQRMRGKAESKGSLKTSSEQKVSKKTTESGKEVIVVEQANPEVVYVPSYDPEVVYGPSTYPYYPYTYPGYYPGMGLAWGAGIVIGAGIINNWGDCDWNGGDININRNNNFNRNVNRNVDRGQGGNRWQHRPEHRGNAPYGDRKTADKFGGRSPGSTRPGGGDRPGGGNVNRPSTKPGGVNRPSTKPGGNVNRPSTRPAGATRPSNSVGNRQVSRSGDYGSRGGGQSRANTSRPSTTRSSSSFSGGGFGGGSGGHVRASSYRGGHSMGGGGFSRGGGGGYRGGGGGRGGGRRR